VKSVRILPPVFLDQAVQHLNNYLSEIFQAPEAMLKTLPGKLIAIAVVICLYAIPWYQKYRADSKTGWSHQEIITQAGKPEFRPESPFFAENFVNQATPGVSCHVSSLAVAGKEKLICTWYAGSREGARDVAIYRAFYDEINSRWSEPGVLIDRSTCSREMRRAVRKLGNALVMRDSRGRLWLFFASNVFGGWSTTSLNYKVSVDEGQTWSAARKLILSPFFNLTNNVKNQGVNLSDGSFLLPVYNEGIHKFSQLVWLRPGNHSPFYEIRKITDTGKAIQPALVHLGKQSLTAFFRNAASSGRKFILRSDSRDVGVTWSKLADTPLPNPNSGFAMLTLADGAYLGVINNSFENRHNLTLVLSRDAGQTWKTLKVLENTPGKEFSYPFIIQSRRAYHVTYTYDRKRIKHVAFNDAWLQGLKAYGD